ncbi:DNA cytosine methyltransferase [Roseofilum sp. BLCC_M91]|uniref:Cytosine-specific methyltransferase n=1 Tax=Roseofilum halophilum BLCC-M91 TaxID=3022259 RepID=A0ABT7BEH0_9CYAN|nr:DNA cytosine methyltransferase [Roseofilum halophilum]MDJ1177571.1 DNA cytosine methyltransferase [Roseofilum halophilum BLCC-M91]
MINNQPISISLFTGAYGLDLGLEQAGFITVSVVEKDLNAVKTIALNRPVLKNSAIPREIEQVTAQELLEEGGKALGLGRPLQPGEVDLITGGPPCQPFSTAGKRGSVLDPRGSLFMDFIRIVKEVQPRFFLMENVKGLLSAPLRHRPINQRGKGYPPLRKDEIKGAALEVVISEMKNIDYQVIYNVLEAADYGVPQTRQRVIFMGSRDSESVTFPLPKYSKYGKNLPKWRTLKDGLKGLVDSEPEFIPYSENRLKYLKLLKAGQNWKNLPEDLKQEAMGGAYHSGGGKVGFYRRLSWDKPSPTITTSPNQKATDMCHPVELRCLTVRESAKLQTFPDDWIFSGSTLSKYKQIGNAVPVLLSKEIGVYLFNLIQGHQEKGQQITEQLSLFS